MHRPSCPVEWNGLVGQIIIYMTGQRWALGSWLCHQRRQTSTHCRVNAGPTSQTLVQRWTSVCVLIWLEQKTGHQIRGSDYRSFPGVLNNPGACVRPAWGQCRSSPQGTLSSEAAGSITGLGTFRRAPVHLDPRHQTRHGVHGAPPPLSLSLSVADNVADLWPLSRGLVHLLVDKVNEKYYSSGTCSRVYKRGTWYFLAGTV